MTPKSLASLGLLAGAIGIAGLGYVSTPEAQVADVRQATPGGGAYYDTGRAFVKKDHGWVKATKYGVAGGKPLDVTTVQKARAFLDTASTAALSHPITVSGISKADVLFAHISVRAYTTEVSAKGGTVIQTATFDALAHPSVVEWISADELLIILETMT